MRLRCSRAVGVTHSRKMSCGTRFRTTYEAIQRPVGQFYFPLFAHAHQGRRCRLCEMAEYGYRLKALYSLRGDGPARLR